MSASAKTLTPGGPALNVTNAPTAAKGSGGTYMEKASAFEADTKHDTVFVPNQSFSYAVGPMGTQAFYKGVPASVSPGLKDKLVAEGLGS